MPRVRPGRRTGFWYGLAIVVLRPPFRLLTRRRWRGAENLPTDGGYVAAVNHLSHIDPFTFAHFMVDNGALPRFLAKESLFAAPFVGRVMRGAVQIPVYRETKNAQQSYSAAVDAVLGGECVAIYPEGTLTRDPDLWPMKGKTGAARVGLATGRPVIPIAQWGAQGLLPPYAKLPRPGRYTSSVYAGPPVDLSPWAGKELSPEVLAAATEAIVDAITALLEEIRGEKAPAERWDSKAKGQPAYGNPDRSARSGRSARSARRAGERS